MKSYTYKAPKLELIVEHDLVVLWKPPGQWYVRYPCDMEAADKPLWDLMVWTLFYGSPENPVAPEMQQRAATGSEIAMAYSGGADSTAMLHLFPESRPVFIERDYEPTYLLSQRPIMRELGNVTTLYTDVERIRMLWRPSHGFAHGMGYAALLAPLAPRRIIEGAIAEGVMFEHRDRVALLSGAARETIQRLRGVYARAGISVDLPFAGLSEVQTTRIVESSGRPYSSCHSRDGVRHCSRCYKCFRKNGILGRKHDMALAKVFLLRRPVQAAACLVYGLQAAGHEPGPLVPAEWLDINCSFCDRYSARYTGEFNEPGEWTREVVKRLRAAGIEPQTADDAKTVKAFLEVMNKEG